MLLYGLQFSVFNVQQVNYAHYSRMPEYCLKTWHPYHHNGLLVALGIHLPCSKSTVISTSGQSGCGLCLAEYIPNTHGVGLYC